MILENYNFSGFIWGPAKKYDMEILNLINKKNTILHLHIYKFDNADNFEKSVLDIYTTDDIDPNKVKNVKISNMVKHELVYTYFKFQIKDSMFRIKEATGNKISQEVELIKKIIRSNYKNKITNYVHDNIIHICDNYEQTKEVEQIMNKYQKFNIYNLINLKYFLKLNFENNLFTRADMLVRKYSIEQYLKDSNYDFLLYCKMQISRTHCNIENLKQRVNNFKNLINSIRINKFNLNFPICYSKNYLLRDGSHRLAYLYLNNVEFIPVKEMEWDNHPDYSINWFKKNNFTQNEIDIIHEECEKLNRYLD